MKPLVEAVDRAIIFCNLRLDGPAASGAAAQLKAALASSGGVPIAVILAGGTFSGEVSASARAAVAAVGQALTAAGVAHLCFLGGSKAEEAALADPTVRGVLVDWLGMPAAQVSFGAALPGGLHGVRVATGARGEAVLVTTRAAIDPQGSAAMPDLLSWSGLRNFVRAWTRQLELTRKLPAQTQPEQRLAQALAQAAAVVVAQGQPTSAPTLLSFGEEPGSYAVVDLAGGLRLALHHSDTSLAAPAPVEVAAAAPPAPAPEPAPTPAEAEPAPVVSEAHASEAKAELAAVAAEAAPAAEPEAAAEPAPEAPMDSVAEEAAPPPSEPGSEASPAAASTAAGAAKDRDKDRGKGKRGRRD